jgi:bifunctional non-homologous end joining protein LigD
MGLEEYWEKRRFERTAEPKGRLAAGGERRRFVIQKHAASRLHYDFRLELHGVLKSWAVPKGPSLDPAEKRLAVHVEDHPVEYGSFEGIIPKGEYGGGTVLLWDRGNWEPLADPDEGYRRGNLKFRLHGEKLHGEWALVRMHGRGAEDKNWLLVKKKDEAARPGAGLEIVDELPRSVATERGLGEIAADPEHWSGKSLDPSGLPHAQRRGQPEVLSPQLALLAREPPEGDDWLHEIKHDGYRMLCLVEKGEARLLTRRGHDWTERFPAIGRAIEALPVESAVYDGEVVVLEKSGRSNFQALQNAMKGRKVGQLVYYLFDLPHCRGYDLTRTPLLLRKGLLRQIVALSPEGSPLHLSDHVRGEGRRFYENACRLGLEGVVSKRADSAYEQRRSRTWLKIKCTLRQEFVVGGYSDPSGSRARFGSLLVGVYDSERRLVFSGAVGTGFDERSLHSLYEQLRDLSVAEPPFANPPRGRGLHWVRPELVIEAEFTEWTEEGLLRHPAFKGLRADKAPEDVAREEPSAAARPAPEAASRSFRAKPGKNAGAFRLTHPERVLYPADDLTKGDLAAYYAAVADRLLPHLSGRPLSIIRCPEGISSGCFYQRHVTGGLPGSLRGQRISTGEGEETFLVIEDGRGLLDLVQAGALELHPWGCRADKPERPDRMIFDLDPGAGVPWEAVTGAALLLRERLEDLGLTSFVKTSGGKGLHVVLPLRRTASWEQVKGFARALAEDVVRESPRQFIATMALARRRGKIFIDYLRNSRSATCVAPYSARARAGAPVSMPVGWDELAGGLLSTSFSVRNAPGRLARVETDPWQGFFEANQALTAAMRKRYG